MHYSALANIIKNRRENLGITQEHLADIAGVGLRTLKSIETGKGNPTISTLDKLSAVLGLEIKLEVIRK
jgi:transcriptional regulator with XRE-family HTH domain